MMDFVTENTMEKTLAKALFDNTAESPDELAFHKGDIIRVVNQTVEGSSGWWRCSLRGQEGLAPANRLQLITLAEAEASQVEAQNIYQIPKTQETVAPIYEDMSWGPKVPSPRAAGGPPVMARKYTAPDLLELKKASQRTLCPRSSPGSDVYDVPTLVRKCSLATVPSPRPLLRKTSLMATTTIQKRYEVMDSRPSIQERQTNVYAVPSSLSQDHNYDVPMPSKGENPGWAAGGYSTMPTPRKSDWIYEVPAPPEKPTCGPGHYDTLPSKGVSGCKPVYDSLPARVWPATTPDCSLYDVPKSCKTAEQGQNSGNESIYDVPPTAIQRAASKDAPTLEKQDLRDSEKSPEPLEYRGMSGPIYDCPRGRPSWGRKAMVPSRSKDGTMNIENEEEKSRGLSVSENQRSSTASTSSSSSRSSCDSLMLSSSSPEPLRELAVSQEEATQRLLELQEAVSQAVPKLMDFVSSRWRSRVHLGQHLGEIRTAAEGVARSVTAFLDFTLDVRGNARRLTDSNLQLRLQRQLSIVEDSGLILQQSVDALGELGWPLEALVQDPNQPQTPDQLERFVMVARTVPEDVKRLVSILNANGKLLFRSSLAKEPETPKPNSSSDVRRGSGPEPVPNTDRDDTDYVQLQTKMEFEQQQQAQKKDDIKEETNEKPNGQKVSAPKTPQTPTGTSSPGKTPPSDYCRLYFGAIKKAISVFVSSLEEGQPPEKFISHGKLVIMVGQRLMDALGREAQNREDSQELMRKSNHMCALLKQLAVATKKAALHFPDKMAVQEVRDFAKELCHWTQQFRMSLDT